MANDNDLPGTKLSRFESKRVFEHRGLQVEERICKWDGSDNYKLLWCLAPLENTVSNGVVNPVCHHEFCLAEYEPGSTYEQAARDIVRKNFDDYWFDSEGKLVERTMEQYKEWKEKQGAEAA